MAKENRQTLGHILGNAVSALVTKMFSTKKTFDETLPDYEWWDRFRHSKIDGYEIAGSIGNTINEIIATWVLGKGVDAKLAPVDDARMSVRVKYTNDVLSRFMTAMQAFFQQMYEDLLGLGDVFIAVNPDDGSLRSIPPNTVRLLTDDLDPLKVVGIEVTTVTDKATIIETFTATERTRQVATYDSAAPNPLTSLINSVNSFGTAKSIAPLTGATTQRFPNLIGRIPIVHFANARGMNELRGRPLVSNLRQILSELDDLMSKSMQGAKISGNPIPVFENLENPKQTIDLNATQEEDTYTDKDGNAETRKVIKFDELGALFLGKGGRFNMAAPPVGFSTDTIAILKFFRELIRDAAHTPGYTYGGDSTINPNMTEQTPAWVKFIDRMRDKLGGQAYDEKLGLDAAGGLYELLQIYLLTRRLIDPRIMVEPVNLIWQEITEDDEKINFEKIKWIQSRGGMTVKRALLLLDLIESSEIDAEVEAAQAEMQKLAELMQPTTDFGGTGNDVKNPPPTTKDNTPDLRKGAGADTPRMPAYGGGGKTK